MKQTLPAYFDLLESQPLPELLNIALDHIIANNIALGLRSATVRIWNWQNPLVVIGSSQSLSNEVDIEAAKRRGVVLARRASGGGTMFMDPKYAITYSVIITTEALSGLSLYDSYMLCDSWVLDGIRNLGVPAFYQPINDIATDEGKIGGAAQRRLANGITIHHATLSWDIDIMTLLDVTRLFRPYTGTRGTKSAQKKVVGIRRYSNVTRSDVVCAMVRELSDGRKVCKGTYQPDEILRAQELVRTRFGTRQWLERIP